MQTTAFLDHFAGDFAILLVEDQPVEIPRFLLPPNLKAGNWVNITIKENNNKTEEVQNRVADLLQDLKDGKHLK